MSGAWEEVRRSVAVAGRVVEELSERPLAGALVEVVEFPAAFRNGVALRARQHGGGWDSLARRADRTTTAIDGLFWFRDLPDGRYTLRACLPTAGSRYGPVRARMRVSEGRVKGLVRMVLPPTVVHGRVTDSGGGPVAMVEVRLRGSGEVALTDGDGRYSLPAVEAGRRSLDFRLQGRPLASRAVRLSRPGWTSTLDLVLPPR